MATPAGVPPPPAGAAPAPAAQPTAQNVTYYVYQMQAPPSGAGVSINIDWSKLLTFYFARILLIVLLWGGWALYLAGTCKEQDNCNSGLLTAGNSPFPAAWAIFSMGGPANFSKSDCAKFYALLWWSVWLQFLTLIAATATMFQMFSKYKLVKKIFTTTLYFMIMSSILLFFICDQFNEATYLAKSLSLETDWKAGTTLTLVGAVISVVLNFIYLIWNSYQAIPEDAVEEVEGPHQGTLDGDAYITPTSVAGPKA